jgi:hypothetical protein
MTQGVAANSSNPCAWPAQFISGLCAVLRQGERENPSDDSIDAYGGLGLLKFDAASATQRAL